MSQKLVTFLEVTAIILLIGFVMYLGGIFKGIGGMPPTPTPTPITPSPTPATPLTTALTATATSAMATQAPAQRLPVIVGALTATATSAMATPQATTPAPTSTFPPLTQPTGLIAFESTRDGNSEIYVMNADGSRERNLTNDPADDMWPSWSPDGKRIAFFSTRNGWLEIYAMDGDGANLVQVTRTLSKNIVYDSPVFWSPNGKEILAVRRTVWNSFHMPDSLALELIRVDGTGATTLFEMTGLYLRPSWSPDGQYIYVYVLAQGEQTQTYSLFIGRLTDTQFEFKLASPDLLSDTYVWSPDSSPLAFEDEDHNIVTIKPDGSDKRQLVSTSHFSLFLQIISWSPDGQYLLYATDGFLFHTVWVDGSGGIDLDSQVKAVDYDSAVTVGWSPDSQWLTYGKQGDIFVVNIYNSASPIQLTRSGNNYSPQWQP